MDHIYFVAEASKIPRFFLSFIKLNRYIILHSHWWRYICIWTYLDFLFAEALQNPWNPPCFYLNSSSSGDGTGVCPEEWAGSPCHMGQYKPGSMGSWNHFWEHLHFGRSLTFPAAEICSAGSDLQAMLWFFLLGEAMFVTHLRGIMHLEKTLHISTICILFLANLAIVWIPLFEDHSDLKIWFTSQWPVLLHLDLPRVWGHRPPQHPAGQCLPSAPAATGIGLGWVKFPTPGIALSWLTPISVPSATAWHLCTSLCWEAASSLSCRISRAGKIPSSYFPRLTTHNVASMTHKYTCVSWAFVKWCDTFGQKDVRIPAMYLGKCAWWGLLGRWNLHVFHVISVIAGWAAHPADNDR